LDQHQSSIMLRMQSLSFHNKNTFFFAINDKSMSFFFLCLLISSKNIIFGV